jgi:hypothetical protein
MNDIPDIPTDEDYDRQASDQGYYRELMNFLSESNSMRDTAKNAVKQSMFAASGAFAGSFIGGPVGGLLGGVAGSLIGFTQSDDYDGAIVALTKLESDRQARLVREIFDVLQTAGGNYQRILDNPETFKNELLRFAEQDAVRNGIWNACLHSARS